MSGVAPAAPRAVAYLRASKEEQRLSPDAQRAAIEAYAASLGAAGTSLATGPPGPLIIVSWHLDADTCSVTPIDQRPGLLAALAALGPRAAEGAPLPRGAPARARGAPPGDHPTIPPARRAAPGDHPTAPTILLVAKRDRIARDVVLAAMVDRAVCARGPGCRILSADGAGNGDAPADQFMRTVIDGASEYERALIRARTKAALAVLRARGEKTGGAPPYGWTVDPDDPSGRRLVPCERELHQIAHARAARAAGASLGAIARAIGPARTGRPFAPSQVARLLAGPCRDAADAAE